MSYKLIPVIPGLWTVEVPPREKDFFEVNPIYTRKKMSLTRPITASKNEEKGRPYNQCKIRKGGKEQTVYQTVYIPSKYAEVGKSIKIRENGVWEDGWVVIEVWQEVDESYLYSLRNAWKRHSEVSDI